MRVPLLRLTAGVNNYEWGKQGKKSAAARYAAASGVEIDESKPYAEDFETGRTLLELIQENVSLISGPISKKFNAQLPFLFKVLSVNKALSIQAHPNKKLAEQLHAKDPAHYPDDNHKPEMTIAITPFDGLCGFRPLAEIAHFLKTVKPLTRLIGEAPIQEFVSTISGHETTDDADQMKKNKAALQKVFSLLMNNALADSTKLKDHCRDLVLQAETETSNFAEDGGPSPNSGQVLSDLVLRLNEQFPGDVGLMVMFFLNYVQLSPGEAMFLRADDIHAYLSGDIIECMAASDNVIRAGFTPKFKDVETLTNTLTYSYAPISEQKMKPTPYPHAKLNKEAAMSNSTCTLYDPPIEEFSVIKTDLGGTGKVTFEPLSGPSIILCTSGRGTIRLGPKFESLEPGFVYFVGATGECILECVGEQRLVTFTAFCELDEQK